MDRLKPGATFGSYRLDKCIGKGAFGAVWSAHPTNGGVNVAIKFEFPSIQKSILEEESKITKAVGSTSSFPKYIESGRLNGLYYLVIELLGMSVRQFQENHPSGIIPLTVVGKLGIGMLHAIRDFHEAGFIHRDIKPSNFVFRESKDERTICLIDFGLAKAWKDEDGSPIPERPNVGFRGTARYASLNSHDGADLGRRDDLWSLFYILVEFCSPPLPWKTQTNKDSVAQIKRRGYTRILNGLSPKFNEFGEHLTHLSFSDTPDYEFLEQLLNSIVEIGDAEGSSPEFGVSLPSQYGSMSLVVAPNTGSIIGSSASVEGSWGPMNPMDPQNAATETNDDEVRVDNPKQGEGGCCLII